MTAAVVVDRRAELSQLRRVAGHALGAYELTAPALQLIVDRPGRRHSVDVLDFPDAAGWESWLQAQAGEQRSRGWRRGSRPGRSRTSGRRRHATDRPPRRVASVAGRTRPAGPR